MNFVPTVRRWSCGRTMHRFIGPYCLPPCTIHHPITVAQIQARVANYYRLPLSEMRSDRRDRSIAWPRQAAMYLAKRHTLRSFPDIGRRFGGRDHTTVIHAVKAVEKRRLEHSEYDAEIRALEASL